MAMFLRKFLTGGTIIIFGGKMVKIFDAQVPSTTVSCLPLLFVCLFVFDW